MASSTEINFWVEQIKKGTMQLEDVPKNIRSQVSSSAGLIPGPPNKLRSTESTVTQEEYLAGSSQRKALETMQKRLYQSIGTAGPATAPAPLVDSRASSMEETIAFMEASQQDATRVRMAFINTGIEGRHRMELIALALVEDRRRRRGWAARFNYPDRGGRHYLEEAIRGSAELDVDRAGGSRTNPTGGSYLAKLGWNWERLEAMTRPPMSRRGFAMTYEGGGSFMMPAGIWIGPVGPNTQGRTGKQIQRGPSRKHGAASFTSLAARQRGNAGIDRFYPTGGFSGVFMHEPAMHVFKESLEATNGFMARKIAQILSGSTEMSERHAALGRNSEISQVYAEDAYTSNKEF